MSVRASAIMAFALWSCTLLGACATGGAQQWARPALPGLPAPPTTPQVEALDTGLRVTHVPASEGAVFEAALLVAAGALDDPADRPGLTHWLVDAAMLATDGDPDAHDTPQRRALLLGGTLVPIADGTMAGWAVTGPSRSAGRLMALLADVALRPSFPPTRLQLKAGQTREHLEEQDDDSVDGAVALAAGMALGVDRPLALGPRAVLFDQLNREDVVRHYKRLVRPDRATLVLPAGAAVPAAFASWRGHATDVTAPTRTCAPQGQATHLLVHDRGQRDRGVVLIALAAPPAGPSVDRAAAETLIELLAADVTGPLVKHLGPAQARRARPRLIDVGGPPGAGASVIILGLAGDHDALRKDLAGVAMALGELDGQARDLDEAALSAARRTTADRLASQETPIIRLAAAGRAAMHGAAAAPPADGATLSSASRRLFAPWRWAVVGVGRAELGTALADVAPLHTWQDGRRIAGPEFPRCLAR